MIVEKEKEVRGSARWGKPHMKKGGGKLSRKEEGGKLERVEREIGEEEGRGAGSVWRKKREGVEKKAEKSVHPSIQTY